MNWKQFIDIYRLLNVLLSAEECHCLEWIAFLLLRLHGWRLSYSFRFDTFCWFVYVLHACSLFANHFTEIRYISPTFPRQKSNNFFYAKSKIEIVVGKTASVQRATGLAGRLLANQPNISYRRTAPLILAIKEYGPRCDTPFIQHTRKKQLSEQ